MIISFNSVFFANHGFTPEHNEVVLADHYTRISFTHRNLLQIVIGIENGISTVCEMLATAALAWSLRSSRTGASRQVNVFVIVEIFGHIMLISKLGST